MQIIQQVTSDYLQQQNISLPDGTTFFMELRFVPMQSGWFFNTIVYESFVLNGYRVCNSPNMLHQFKNQIPFGIACLSNEEREPSLQEDFSSGNSVLYLLNEEEVAQYTEFLVG